MEVGVHIIVTGMVQGVGFRYFVCNRASRLGLNGYVCNVHNGNVEIRAEGERSLIEELIKEVKTGPRASRVADVSINWKQPEYQFREFTIR